MHEDGRNLAGWHKSCRNGMATLVLVGVLSAGPVIAAGSKNLAGAEQMLREGQFDKAIALVNKAFKSDQLSSTASARALYTRGNALLQTKRPAEAISDLTSAIWTRKLPPALHQKAIALRAGAYSASGVTAPTKTAPTRRLPRQQLIVSSSPSANSHKQSASALQIRPVKTQKIKMSGSRPPPQPNKQPAVAPKTAATITNWQAAVTHSKPPATTAPIVTGSINRSVVRGSSVTTTAKQPVLAAPKPPPVVAAPTQSKPGFLNSLFGFAAQPADPNRVQRQKQSDQSLHIDPSGQ